MTALVHMTDDDLKALGIPMVNTNRLGHKMHSFLLLFFFSFLSLAVSYGFHFPYK